FFISRRRYRDARKLALDDSCHFSGKRGANGHRTGASWRANESIDCEMGKAARGADGVRLHCGDCFFCRLPFGLTPNHERIAEQPREKFGTTLSVRLGRGHLRWERCNSWGV